LNEHFVEPSNKTLVYYICGVVGGLI